MPINQEYLKKLRDNDIPPRLSVHLANLLVRDPLVIFEKKIYVDDKTDRSHFEGFNSTNWNSLRFKPPRPEDNDSCFKVEVRPSDLQLTPFENAAILTFTYIYSKIVFRYGGNFIIPITLVDQNFERGYKTDAYVKEKFWWKVNGIEKDWKNYQLKNITETHCYESKEYGKKVPTYEEDIKNIKELTLEEIICGCDDYIGLLPLMYEYIEDVYNKEEEKKIMYKHLKFIEMRAKGLLWTDAKYIRNFVLNHPKYNKDSIVTHVIII
jgi:glutamate--cysteine ligase catalytic subunit